MMVQTSELLLFSLFAKELEFESQDMLQISQCFTASEVQTPGKIGLAFLWLVINRLAKDVTGRQ